MVDPVFSKSLKWNIICSPKYNNEHYSFVTSSREWYLNFIYQMKIINFLSKISQKIRLLLTTSKSEVVTPKQKEKKTEENRNLILFCFPLIGCGLRGLEFHNNFSRSYDRYFFFHLTYFFFFIWQSFFRSTEFVLRSKFLHAFTPPFYKGERQQLEFSLRRSNF
jgi:hypothetical protein